MVSIVKNIAKSAKRSSFGMLLSASRINRSGHSEEQLQELLVRKFAKNRARLRSLAWMAESRNDQALAIMAWSQVAQNLANKSSKAHLKTLKRIAGLEVALRRRVYAAGGQVFETPPGLPYGRDGHEDDALSPYLLKTRLGFLQRYWRQTIPSLSKKRQTTLRRVYCDLALSWSKTGRGADAMLALEPVLAVWPDKQIGYLSCHQSILEQLLAKDPDAGQAVPGWWALFDHNRDRLSEQNLLRIWSRSEKMARRLIARNMPEQVQLLMAPAFQRWPEHHEALAILGRAAELSGDWTQAALYWQLRAALTNPVTTKTMTHVAENPEELLRQSRHALKSLRNSRFRLAQELYQQGRKREFAELLCRAVEMIPDQRIFKKERHIIDLVRCYVQDALAADGAVPDLAALADNKPLKIAICLDVLKLSDIHTHSRVVFAICHNLMRLNPQIETHIIVTNERFAVTTPVVSASFAPNMAALVQEAARATLPDYYGRRFFLHHLDSIGLEGLIDSCKRILDLAPDVILYGGGHRGLFSNESRVIRHCLFDYVPTAFFYIQANNEADDKLDMIITRGPHEVLGEHGHEQVTTRQQPYPTIVDDTIPEVFNPQNQGSKVIVSAITGVRMNVKMAEQSDEDLTRLFSILDQSPGAVWHFIGAADPQALIEVSPLIAERVAAGQVVVHPVLPFEDFHAFINEQAALFLHPPGFTGGSGGATVARRAGIPILTFRHSDVSGRQPPETVFDPQDIDAYVQQAIRLLQDPEEWERIVRLQFAHTKWIKKTSSQGFYDCLCETVAISQQRREGDDQAGL